MDGDTKRPKVFNLHNAALLCIAIAIIIRLCDSVFWWSILANG